VCVSTHVRSEYFDIGGAGSKRVFKFFAVTYKVFNPKIIRMTYIKCGSQREICLLHKGIWSVVFVEKWKTFKFSVYYLFKIFETF